LYVPMHKSNSDSIWVSWALAFNDLSMPRFAAGINLITDYTKNFIFKRLGSYTVDREEKRNFLYMEVLKQYSSFLLENGINSLIFAEGTRSRNGAIGNLHTGLLDTALNVPILKKYNIVIVPMALSYESVPEDNYFCKYNTKVWAMDYISKIKKVYINFCDPINIDNSLYSEDSIKSLSDNIVNSWKQNVKILPNHIFCKVIKDNSYKIEKTKLVELTQQTLDKIKGDILTTDVERIIKEGKKFLIWKKAITEDEQYIHVVSDKIIDYYGNMIP
ncbi:MAG: glycerol-3-phosphate dehydrogenase, partial [Bacteroidetes bacterium]|nr:glycerol-3-phosphate dehydrogenase [Bacteroidota bacterium]